MLLQKSDIDRFFQKVCVSDPDDCWFWTASTNGKYGKFSICGKKYFAHRISYQIYNFIDPKEKCVLHKCDVPICVNPKHLFLGTSKDNHQDKCRKGRHHNQIKIACPIGHIYSAETVYLKSNGGIQCKICARIHNAEYQKNNKEKINLRNRLRYSRKKNVKITPARA